ncbi:hypothetical protein WA026_017371 [Henosepilachna vigintioctopunctata]|uniref:Endonuclease/exonuclease/phosphatase domain-containing protein n=1 Tax=Henosepilachna vigintioctopunctata TaxID=420089 RepID=A0AAW1VGT4_9CUCU
MGVVSRFFHRKAQTVPPPQRSPDNSNIVVFRSRINDVLDYVYKPGVNIILLGDFNIDPIRYKDSFLKISNIMESYQMRNTVYEKTRDKYTIDYIFTNILSGSSAVMEVHYSDHNAILFTAQHDVPPLNAQFKRDFSH